MKIVYAGIAAIALLAGPAVAADRAPLAPGKPAGVKKAQDADTMTMLYLVGGGAVIAGIVVLASDNNSTPTQATPLTATASTST